MKETWNEQTQRLLSNRSVRMSLRVIAEDTGLSYEWLQAYSQQRYDNPQIGKVQTLHDYLVKHVK